MNDFFISSYNKMIDKQYFDKEVVVFVDNIEVILEVLIEDNEYCLIYKIIIPHTDRYYIRKFITDKISLSLAISSISKNIFKDISLINK